MDATINTVEAQADLQFLRGLTSDDQFHTLVEWFLGKNAQRRSVAAAVMTHAGQAATRVLLDEALSSGRSQKRRLQLLSVIEQLRLPLDISDWFNLPMRARRFGPSVQTQIGRLLTRRLHDSAVNTEVGA